VTGVAGGSGDDTGGVSSGTAAAHISTFDSTKYTTGAMHTLKS